MKSFYYCLLAVTICASQSALGSINISPSTLPVAGDWIEFVTTPGRTGSGGPFEGRIVPGSTPGNVNNALNNTSNTWYTFCVEAGTQSTTENVSLGTNYRVGSVSQFVASATNNVVTEAARFVYYAYGHNLSVGAYSLSDFTGAQIQEVIWSLVVRGDISGAPVAGSESDYSTVYSPNGNGYWLAENMPSGLNGLRNAAIAAMSDSNNVALANRIMIVNPVTNNGGSPAQSMLFEVPEPATIVVWSALGLLGIAASRRFAAK